MARKLPYRDYEGDMAKAQLEKIEKYAHKLNEMIHPEDELESWVQSKLSVIASYIGDIKHYLDYQLKDSEEELEEWEVDDDDDDDDDDSLKVEEESSFVEDMEEAKEYVGVKMWDNMSTKEKMEKTKNLKAQGLIGFQGKEGDIEDVLEMSYKDGGKVDSFYLLGKYQALSRMLLWKLKDDSTYDIYRQMLYDLQNEVDSLSN